jgi:hypothetical protein
MKNLVSNRAKKIIIGLVLLFLPVLLTLSQGPPSPGGTPPPGSENQSNIKHGPIDGGLGIILLMSGGYAIFNLRRRKKTGNRTE